MKNTTGLNNVWKSWSNEGWIGGNILDIILQGKTVITCEFGKKKLADLILFHIP